MGNNIVHKFLVKFGCVLGGFKNRLKIYFKFSLQIHRRVEAGRGLGRSSGPASLLKQSQWPRTMSLTGHHWEHPGSTSFVSSLQVFIHTVEVLLPTKTISEQVGFLRENNFLPADLNKAVFA